MRFSFDLDGTLVDSLEDITVALQRAVVAFAPGVTYARSDVRGYIGRGAGHLVHKALRDRGLDLDEPAVLERFLAVYESTLTGRTTVYPGIAALLTRLHDAGHALAVCTNKPGDKARQVVAALLPAVFTTVLGPDDVGARKPDPTMLHRAADALGGPLHAHVGDSAFDIDAAVAAGVRPVAVTWGYVDAHALPAVETAHDADGLGRLLVG